MDVEPRPEFSALARVVCRLFAEDICRVTIDEDFPILRVVGTIREGAGIPLPEQQGRTLFHGPLNGVRARPVKRSRAVRLWAGSKTLGRGTKRHTLFFQPSIDQTIVLHAWQQDISERCLALIEKHGGHVDRSQAVKQ